MSFVVLLFLDFTGKHCCLLFFTQNYSSENFFLSIDFACVINYCCRFTFRRANREAATNYGILLNKLTRKSIADQKATTHCHSRRDKICD